MFELIDRVALVIPAFLLTFIRLTGLMTAMPVLSYPMITNRVRIALVAELDQCIEAAHRISRCIDSL